jgi:hypothetical protein
LKQASAWIRAELERQGISVTGAIEQPHDRPWSTVLCVPSTEGDIYFKAASPALAHEPALTEALCKWRPDCMPPVLAVDLERGWMLTPDLGATLRSLIKSTDDLHHWQRLLPLYAEVQIDMTSRVDDLLKIDVLDRRLSELPGKYEALLSDTDALLLGHPDGLTTEEHQRLRKLMPTLRSMSQQLASYNIPETLHHEDFHDANIFVRNSQYIFSDWGESSVAHPFCTMLVTSRVIAWRLELTENAPELEYLRDIYLEPWTSFESRENLVAAFKMAYRLGMVCRALTWRRILVGEEESYKAEVADRVPGWLQEFLESEKKPAD